MVSDDFDDCENPAISTWPNRSKTPTEFHRFDVFARNKTDFQAVKNNRYNGIQVWTIAGAVGRQIFFQYDKKFKTKFYCNKKRKTKTWKFQIQISNSIIVCFSRGRGRFVRHQSLHPKCFFSILPKMGVLADFSWVWKSHLYGVKSPVDANVFTSGFWEKPG